MNTLSGVGNKTTVPVTPHTNEYSQKNREENCLSKIQQIRFSNFLVYKENNKFPELKNIYQGSNAENKLTKDVLLVIENDFKEDYKKVFEMIKKPFVIQMDKYGYFFSYACYDHLTDKLVEVQDNLTLSNHAVLSLRSNVENLLKHITHLNSQIFSREGFIYKNYLLGRVVQENYAKKAELKETDSKLDLLDTSVSIIANDYVKKTELKVLETKLDLLDSSVLIIGKVFLEEVSNLKINMQGLENRVTDLEGRVSDLEDFKQSTDDRLKNLENVNNVTKSELAYFNNQFWKEHEGKHQYSSTVQDIKNLFDEVKSLKDENQSLKNFIAEQQEKYNNTIQILVNRVDCLERLPGTERRVATIHDIEDLDDADMRSIK